LSAYYKKKTKVPCTALRSDGSGGLLLRVGFPVAVQSNKQCSHLWQRYKEIFVVLGQSVLGKFSSLFLWKKGWRPLPRVCKFDHTILHLISLVPRMVFHVTFSEYCWT